MPRSTLEGRAQGGASLGLFALLLFGALRFLQGAVPLSTGLAVLAAAGAGAVWWAVRQDGRPGWLARGWRTGAAGLLAWVAVRGAAAVAPATLSSAQSAYVIGAGLAGALAFGALRRSQAGSPAGRSWTENLRLFLLIALAAWLFQSFLSSDFYGRVDARSYAYSMIDALSQERAGHLPVFVGQTEFMFNGSVHPMRTAPYHYILGMLLDLLTGRALTPVAIEHLTVLVTAVQAALTCYLCLAALAPDRRWLAWLMAALYVSAPAPAAYLHGLEMYMTFMTFAFLPLVLMENVRLIRNDGGAGWVRLASALALVWLCHAPVALWLTLCTVALQGLRLMTRDFAAAAWARAAGGAALCGGLLAGYIWSVVELSAGSSTAAAGGPVPWAELLLVVGAVAVARLCATGRWPWLAAAAGVGGGLFLLRREYAAWLGLVALGAVALAVVRRGAFRPVRRERLAEWTVLLFLAAGLGMLPWMPREESVPAIAWVHRFFPANLLPVSPQGLRLTDVQVGAGLWGACLLGVAAAALAPSWEIRLFVLVGALWAALLVPIPGVTRLLLTLLPSPVYAVSTTSAWQRYVPVMVALGAFLGFLGGGALAARFPRWRKPLYAALGLALAWSLVEAHKFVRSGYRNVNSPETIAAFYRPENANQFAYLFPGMPVSPYLTNGVVDYHLESRLLRADDPDEEIGRPFVWNDVPQVTLEAAVDAAAPTVLHLSPALTLAPGGRVALQFEFLDRRYDGTLICRGPQGYYREYPLPEAGFFGKSFGVAPSRPKVIALWNSSSRPQPVELQFAGIGPQAPGAFARIRLQAYDPARLPVETTSLLPYRARTRPRAEAWLETPRLFIPGYSATVNGRAVPVVRSPNDRAMIRVPAGDDRVELRYAGTGALRAALLLSGLCWLGVLGLPLRKFRRRKRSLSPAARERWHEEAAATAR